MRATLAAAGVGLFILLCAVLMVMADAAAWHEALGAPFRQCHGQQGIASWYGAESGSITATGHHFNPNGMTAAMPSRSMLGKHVRVTDMRTGRSIVVLVDDIGPAAWTHRAIDLAHGAARRLGMGGLSRVCLTHGG